MNPSRVLLIEDAAGRAERIMGALSTSGLESFRTKDAAEALEALAVRQFDLILISSERSAASVAGEFGPMARKLCPSAAILIYGDYEPGAGDGVIPASVPESDLGQALIRFRKEGGGEIREETPSQIALFDLPSFRQQMGNDDELMKEVIGIFFEESVQQLDEMRRALESRDYIPLSRVAHSLKGSLGSLHADRARHWAQALETAAVSNDQGRSERCLRLLMQTVEDLTPTLQRLFSE
jgi:HPt (histidine-containing phosphotransfer) domain-containing protein